MSRANRSPEENEPQQAQAEPATQPQPAKPRQLPPAQALFLKGLQHQRAGRQDEAAAHYLRTLEIDRKHSGAWANLGIALRSAKRFEAALACYRRAMEVSPDPAMALGNVGNVLKDLGRLDESIAAHESAVALDPENAKTQHNYGISLKEAGRLQDALDAFDKACAIEPDFTGALWDRALVLLHLERFADGWPAYEVRWDLDELPARPYRAPRWRGEDFAGKRLLIYPEQGFGDAILASRFVPLAKRRGGEIIFECKPETRRLFSTLEGVDRFTVTGDGTDEAAAFDLHCPIMSLPGLFQADLDNLPPAPTLCVPQSSLDKFRPLFDRDVDRFKIGIVWSGSLTFKGNRTRSTSLSRFLELTEIPGIQLYSLHKGPLERQLVETGANAAIVDIGGKVEDFADTAAAIQFLDLVIMTDSATAHLTASLGKPIWNLLPFMPYWLYLMDRDDSPWYPTMRLFRQTSHGDWDGVFRQVTAALREAVEAKRAGRWPG